MRSDAVRLCRFQEFAVRWEYRKILAYDYYLRGRSLLSNRSGTDRGRMVAEARGMFEKSLAADADYAQRG